LITHNVKDTENEPTASANGGQQRREWLAPLVCAGIYILCTLMGAATITTIAGLSTHISLFNIIVHVGSWLPKDFTGHNIKETRQFTATMEWYAFLIITFVVYVLCAYFIYRLLKVHNDRRTRRLSYGLIIAVTLISCLFYLLAPAHIATDMYSYESYGRLMAIHGANPYFVPPSAFPQDITFRWLYWTKTTSIYGPIWMLISAALAFIGNPTQMSILLQYRCVALLAHLITTYLVYKGLRTLGRSERTVALGTLLYAWNPLVLVESVLGAHNDIVMVMFLVAGFYWLAKAERNHIFLQPRGYLPPIIAFTLATLVKFSAAPALAVCVLAILFARIQADSKAGRLIWWPALRSAIIASVIGLLLIILPYSPFWIGHSAHDIIATVTAQPSSAEAINSLLSTFVYYNDAHQLPAYLAILKSHKLWSLLNILAMLAPIAIGCLYLRRKQDTRTIALIIIASFAGFLITAPWFFSWYLTWIIGVVPFILPIEKSRFTRALLAFSLTFSATAFMAYYTTWVGWMQLDFKPPQIFWSVVLNVILIGGPLLAFLGAWYYWPFTGKQQSPTLPVKSSGTES
jgi:4-amino-4-deoxy-L-arabinose transferase and related glycosyltransferases of PMT family